MDAFQSWLLLLSIFGSFQRNVTAEETPIIPANDIVEARLITHIAPANRIIVRPAKNFSQPTDISIELRIVHIIDLVTAMQEVKLTASFFLTWTDPFLKWNPEEYDNITSIRIPGSSVWKPEFTVLNNINERLEHGTKRYLRVTHEGTVIWQPKDILQLKCEVYPVLFPFDTQRCNITIMMLNVPSHEANLAGRTSAECPLSFMPNLEWVILHQDVSNHLFQSSYGDNFNQVIFGLVMKRNPTFYGLNTVFPIVLLHVIGLMIFLLPAESGEKVSFGMACLMSFFITQLLIAEQVPRSWVLVPVIMVFNFSFLLLTGISVVVAVLVVNLKNRTTPVPAWLECIFERDKWKRYMSRTSKVDAFQTEKDNMSTFKIYKISDNIFSTDNQTKSTQQDAQMKEKGGPLKDKSDFENDRRALKEGLQKISNYLDNKEKKESENQKWKAIGNKVNNILLAFYMVSGILMILLCSFRWMGWPQDEHQSAINYGTHT